ncbi:MAG: helix-turn-helix transcriptional regulator [Xanthobacteraceae bacterium]|nr:helix-turn-helix transcriptional regulator [Xanthobacteraceae bacterium]
MQKLTLSTANLPAHLDDRERFRTWQDAYCAWVGSTDLRRDRDEGTFNGRWDIASVDDVMLVRFNGSAHSVARSPQQIAAAPQDRYFISFNLAARALSFAQQRDAIDLHCNQALLFSGTDAFRAEGASDWMSVGISKVALRRLVPNVDDLVSTTFDGEKPATHYLRRYLGMLMDLEGPVDATLARHIETAVHDVVALAIGATGDTAAIARQRGLRAARRAEILDHMRNAFADPALSVNRVAAWMGVSPSYIQKLLHEVDLSFTEQVLELRLTKARQMLANRRNDHLKISDIALACGFSEISYFNRCFRRRFGDAPSTWRVAPPD